MIPMIRRVAELATLALVWAIVTIPITWAQAPPPSEQMQTMSFGSPIEPEFKYARNMAILDRFGVNTFNNLFEYFAYSPAALKALNVSMHLSLAYAYV